MATLVLFVWPLVAMALFSRLGQAKGLIWATLIGALFLPENYGINLPGLPPLDKETSIILGLLLGLMVGGRAGQPGQAGSPAAPALGNQGQFFVVTLGAMLVISPFATMLANPERLVFGPTTLPGLGVRDLISMLTDNTLFLVPLILARRHLASPEIHVEVLRALVILGALYSLLILFEARMSPQLHRWIYGYFQHVWVQHIRGGAFRPIVFMAHGLWIGIFLFTCTLAAFALIRSNRKIIPMKIAPFLWGGWFFCVLVLSRNFGALALTLLFLPLVWFFSVRMQLLVAAVVAGLMITYPMFRNLGLVPMDQVVSVVGSISAERQQSFQYRLDHEELLIERTQLKPLTGWGGWARGRIIDPVSGRDVTVADGMWMVVLGQRGWLGYLPFFGFLGLPMLLILRRRRITSRETAGIALILSGTLVYQVPNATIGPMTLLLAGALWGGLRERSGVQQEPGDPEQAVPVSTGPPSPYTRFPAPAGNRPAEDTPTGVGRPGMKGRLVTR